MTVYEQSTGLPASGVVLGRDPAAMEAVKLGVAAQEASDKFRHAGFWNVQTDPEKRAAQIEAYELLRVEMVQAVNKRDAALAALK